MGDRENREQSAGTVGRSLVQGFLDRCGDQGASPALEVGGQSLDYQSLGRLANGMARLLGPASGTMPLGGVFAARSTAAYAGILATLVSGRGYVPLNPKFPVERSATMLRLSGADTLVVGLEALPHLDTVLDKAEKELTVVFPTDEPPADLVQRHARHKFFSPSDLDPSAGLPSTPAVDSAAPAYVMFTSGTTGVPKGVPVSHANATAYVDYVGRRYAVGTQDRFSQMFDLTFDLSVHDMFVCWEHGACLCVVPENAVMAPARFIRDRELTMWFSVPSVAMYMEKFRMLKPGAFPSLRYSLFCGEPLPLASAKAFHAAAPQSVLENLYGPTEATIAISHYSWDPEHSEKESTGGIVPIGLIFDSQEGVVADLESGLEVPLGSPGELCLGGSQVSAGYLNAPDKNKTQFVSLPGRSGRWYRTGDLVRRDERGCLFYIGRVDDQTQVRGFRVELQEVDQVVRRAAATDLAVAVPYPFEGGRADALYACVHKACEIPPGDILSACAEKLPEYMVPADVMFLDDIPLNSNGKIDKRALARLIGEWINA